MKKFLSSTWCSDEFAESYYATVDIEEETVAKLRDMYRKLDTDESLRVHSFTAWLHVGSLFRHLPEDIEELEDSSHVELPSDTSFMSVEEERLDYSYVEVFEEGIQVIMALKYSTREYKTEIIRWKEFGLMDPDENLKQQLEIAAKILDDVDNERRLDHDAAIRLAELVQSLDEWVKKGGFLPKEWYDPQRLRPPGE